MFFVTPAYAEEAPAAATGTDAHAAPAAGEVHTETGVAGGEHARGPFPPFDSTTFASQLLWLVITFTVFYLLMNTSISDRAPRCLGASWRAATHQARMALAEFAKGQKPRKLASELIPSWVARAAR